MKRLPPFLFAAALAVVLLTGCDRLMSVEQRLDRAQSAFDAGHDSAAMADVKTVLEREPANAAGRILLARLTLRLGDATTARKELERAVQAGVDASTASELDQSILLAQGRFADALAAAQKEAGDQSTRRQLVIVEALMGLGRTDEARKALDAALAAAPQDRELQLADARWAWASGSIKEAGEALDRLLAKYPDFARAAFYRGRMAMAIGDARRAQAVFETASAHMSGQLDLPEQFGVLVGLVESRIALGDLKGADTDLAVLSQRAPGAFATHYLKARVAYARRDFAAAATELREALKADPGSLPGRLLLGAVLTEQGSLEQAGAELSRLVAENPENIEARKQLARVLLARRDPVAARRVLAEAPASTQDAGADWMSGSLLLMSGETEEGIAKLEEGAATEPGNVRIRLDLANAYLLAGRRDEALALLQALSPEAGGARRSQLLVLAGASGKDRAAARQSILKLAQENPRDTSLKVVGGYYLLANGEVATARGLFEEALRAEPKNASALLGRAVGALQAGDPADAQKGFREVLAVEPDSERAYVGLAMTAFAQSDRAGAAQWLEKSISTNPSAVESRLRLAELKFAERDPVKANALLDQALATTRSRAATLDRAGQILMRASQFDAALKRFNEAAALGSPQAGVNAAMAMIALGRVDDARARLEAAVRERPAWVAPNALLVQLDIGQKRFDRALDRVSAFEKAGGPVATADEWRGEALFAAGRTSQAAEAFGRAARARPSAALAIKVYRAASASGMPHPEAGLANWLKDHPQDPMVRVALAEHYQRAGNRAKAIVEYEAAAGVWQGAAVLNNLAWLYQEAGDPRALEVARRAHQMAPENHDIADTYGWILLNSGNIAGSLPILEGAARAEPASAEIQYHYAAALAKNGQKEAAATVLRKLIEQNESFPSRSAAQALLESLT